MANALYDKGREAFLRGEISWQSDTMDVILVKTGSGGYTANLVEDQFLEDVPLGSRVALLSNNLEHGTQLQNKTTTAGVAGANDVRFDEVSGDEVGAIVIYHRKDTDTETTSPLVAYIDTGAGLPVTPTGVDIEVKWNKGPDKIFKL